MSRTLYSRPAEDVSTTHMEELMVNVGQTDYSSLFVRVSGARAGTTTWMTSIVSDFHILFDESRTVDFECKGRAYPISSKSSIRRFVTLRLGR